MTVIDDNKLKKIHDPKEVGSLLLTIKEREESCLAWRMVGDKKVLAAVKFLHIKRLSLEIVVKPQAGHESSFRQVLGNGESLNFFVPHTSFLFQTRVKETLADGSLVLAFPDFMAHVERRRWLRLPCSEDKRVRIQFCRNTQAVPGFKQFFNMGLYDIGAGGMSFLVSQAAGRFFYPNETLAKVELLIEDRKTVVDAEILRVTQVEHKDHRGKPFKQWKVSLRFSLIDSRDQDEISKFVFTNLNILEKVV